MEQIKIGSLIAKLRKEKNLTQSELGEKLGVSYKAISKWERGINMPDASLYKPLCDILGITIDELMTGENKQNKKRKNKTMTIMIIIILFLLLAIIIINTNKKSKYPKITIDNIEIKTNDKNNLINLLLYTNDNLWYYSLDDVKVCTYIKTCYNLGTAINHKQIKVKDLKDYLDETVLFKNTKRYILFDGGTTVYENSNYAIILCQNLNNNRDIYIGPPDLVKKLNGNYCGHNDNSINYFTRTYKVLNIYAADDETYQNITLSQFQNGLATISISKEYKLEINKTYEFTFYTYKLFEDTIENLFKEATLTEVKETNNVGLAQKQESIRISK